MVFEHIEKLKQEYTDKYVTVDESRPELRRFGGMTGTVRTVNMSGRALVEFDAYNNIGWYDIDVDFLKVIDEPLAKPDEKAAPKKAAAKASPKAAPADKKAPAAKPGAKAGGGMSVADMLAAARGDKGGGAAPAKSDSKASVADTMAAARTDKGGGAAAPAPAKTDPKSMSVADMMATLRAQDGGGGGGAATPATPASTPPAAAAPAPAAPSAPAVDPKSMSVADMLATLRAQDGEGGGSAPPVPAADATPAPAASDDPRDSVRDLLEAGRSPKDGTAAAAGKPDDLKLIKGIGPKIDDLLREAGITTFAQLAEQPLSRLKEILDASGSDRLKQIANEETWPEQAAAFASGIAPAQDEPAAEEAPAPEPEAAAEAPSGDGAPRTDITAVDEQIAYCRQVDGG